MFHSYSSSQQHLEYGVKPISPVTTVTKVLAKMAMSIKLESLITFNKTRFQSRRRFIHQILINRHQLDRALESCTDHKTDKQMCRQLPGLCFPKALLANYGRKVPLISNIVQLFIVSQNYSPNKHSQTATNVWLGAQFLVILTCVHERSCVVV